MNSTAYDFIILGNEVPADIELWLKALQKHPEVRYQVIDITKEDWYQKLKQLQTGYYITRPTGLSSLFKLLYDERILILAQSSNIPLFPSLTEVLIYENKRFLSYWLQAYNIPHPKTHVFYHKEEALAFIERADFPVVGKINIGASGDGVTIIENKQSLKEYIDSAFGEGLKSRSGPKLSKGNFTKRLFSVIKNPYHIINRIKVYQTISADIQKNFILIQEYIPHDFEWRCVRIGDSFFAHKKITKNKKASGSLIKGYDTPPLSLLNFIKKVTDDHQLYGSALDIFETSKGEYLINEIQCYFGQSDPYQMAIDGIPGRYIYNNSWVFEPGDFASNACFDLRLEYVLNKIKGNAN